MERHKETETTLKDSQENAAAKELVMDLQRVSRIQQQQDGTTHQMSRLADYYSSWEILNYVRGGSWYKLVPPISHYNQSYYLAKPNFRRSTIQHS